MDATLTLQIFQQRKADGIEKLSRLLDEQHDEVIGSLGVIENVMEICLTHPE